MVGKTHGRTTTSARPQGVAAAGRPRRRSVPVALCAVALLVVGTNGVGQEEELSADWYASEARRSIRLDQFRRAVELLEEAQEAYPDARDFPIILGDLYYDEELYGPALDAYRQAMEIAPENYVILHQVAATLSRLNREREAIEQYERLRSLFPDDSEAFPRLGWLYFKTHQLEEGEAVLLEGLELYPDDRLILMTLATVYAAMYDYERSEHYYMESIDRAEATGDNAFAALAYYNLSLLEREFHHFDRSLDYTNRSIARMARASGYLARGELLEKTMNLTAAEAEYARSYETDADAPFAQIRLADLYRKTGRLDAAKDVAEEVFQSEDLSWIYGFGTDVDRHLMEIHELLADIYEDLNEREKHRAIAGFGARLSNVVERARLAILAWYHRGRFAFYANRVADDYREANNELDAAATYMEATRSHPDIALRYLEDARRLEMPLIPETRGVYLVEEAKLRRSESLFRESLSILNPEWEQSVLEEARLELAKIFVESDRLSEADTLIAAAYDKNRGAFRREGIGVPAVVETNDHHRRLTRYLRDVGFRTETVRPVVRIRVTFTGNGLAGFALDPIYASQDDGAGAVEGRSDPVASGTFPLGEDINSGLAALAERIAADALQM